MRSGERKVSAQPIGRQVRFERNHWNVVVDPLRTAALNYIMGFRTLGLMSGLLLMAGFVSAEQTPSETASGIEGVISISPVRAGPVRADDPISKPLPNTSFAVENQSGEVASFTTDNEGRFH